MCHCLWMGSVLFPAGVLPDLAIPTDGQCYWGAAGSPPTRLHCPELPSPVFGVFSSTLARFGTFTQEKANSEVPFKVRTPFPPHK